MRASGGDDHDALREAQTSADIRAALERLHDAALARCYNAYLEAGVLGACLANTRAYEAIRDIISADVFSDPINAVVWELYESHYARGLTPDAITLRAPLTGRMLVPGKKVDRLEDEAEWTDAGRTLASLLGAMVPQTSVVGYAKDLRDLWTRRHAAKQAIEVWRASVGEAPVEQALAEAADTLDRLRTGPRQTGGPMLLQDAMDQAVRATEAAVQAQGMTGVTSGFETLDRLLRSYQPGRLYYLAGRPGMGKSAAAQSMLRYGSASEDGALVFALEMDEAMVGEREVAMSSGVDFTKMAFGEAPQADWDAAVVAIGEAKGRRIWIDSRPRLSPADVVMTARRHIRRHPIKLIVIDHIHLMRPPKELLRANRTEQLEGISAALKEAAKELGVAMLILAQLSRAVDQREDKRPEMADLRSSGALEQDADAVMFIYRPGYYTAQEKPPALPPDTPSDDPRHVAGAKWFAKMEAQKDIAELILAKNRGGRPGTVSLHWDAERTLFSQYRQGGAEA